MVLDEFFDYKPKRKRPQGVAKKGEGAWYSHSILELGETRIMILKVLKEQFPKWLTSWHITYLVNKKREDKKQKHLAFGTVSGRLSELLGLDYVQMSNDEVELYDSELMSFGWPEKPTWRISGKRIRFLEG